jgi:acyl carrier protein
MTPEQAEAMVRAVLHEVAPDADLDTLRDDADLREALELDSLDFLQVVEILSERSGLRIDEEDYPRLRTLGSAVHWLAPPVVGLPMRKTAPTQAS